MTHPRPVKSYLMDMDGVIVREDQLVPGADRFIARLREAGRKFLVLTNNPRHAPRDLAARLRRLGLDVNDNDIWTSALATARFIATNPDDTSPSPEGPLPATG
jgi:NagD protein